MSTINNPYNNNPVPQYPQQPMLPQLPMQRTGAGGWKQRLLGGNLARPLTLRQERTFPNWLIGRSVMFFFLAMFACWGTFGYLPELDLWLTAVISVLLFFYGGMSMAKSWSHNKEKAFIKNVYVVGFVIAYI